MTFCYYGKVMTGDQKGNLNPNGQLTRAEFAQVLKNFSVLKPTYVETVVSIPVAAQDGIPAHEIPATLTLPVSASKDAATRITTTPPPSLTPKAAADYLAGLRLWTAGTWASWAGARAEPTPLLAAEAHPDTFQAVVTWSAPWS